MFQIEVGAIGDTLTLKVPGGTVDLSLGKERYIDLQGDSSPDIKVVWNDVDRTSPQVRVNLGLYRTTGQPMVTSAGAATPLAAGQATDTGTSAVPAAATTAPMRSGDFAPVTLTKNAEASSFTIDFTFTGDCLFRFLVDDKDREDRFFQKGEQFSIEAAQRQVTIWLSNAGAVRMQMDNRDFELGALGEVATRKVAWRKDAAAAGYVLEITALY
jgi:cytoskeletal protein RodZ